MQPALSTAGVPSPRIRAVALLAALALALAGCAHEPPLEGRTAHDEVPAAWAEGAGYRTVPDPGLAGWWARLGDPVLVGLVEDALRANATVETARAALAQSRALRDVAAAALGPSLGLSASAQRSAYGHAAAVDRFKAGLDASWEIDLFGGRRDAVTATEATAQASEASLADAQVSVAAEVALGYIALRNAQARDAIARDNLESQRETLQITQWRQQAGLVSTLEAEQARASAELTTVLLPALDIVMAQSRHALAVLTGRPPAALEALLGPSAPLPRASEDLALAIPADTLRQRADVRAAERRIAAALARVDEAEAARLPTFNVGGSIGLEALTIAALSSGASLARAVLASVSMPLVDGGARRAQVRVQQAALVQAQVAYVSAVRTALKDVEDALVALRGDRERLVHLQAAALAAGNAATLARQRFGSGLVDFQVVLDTQRTQLATQEGVANADADIVADHVRLYRALGGGWRPEVPPVPPDTRTQPS